MPIYNGCFFETTDYPYEKAATYQLNSYVTLALVDIHKIENESTSDLKLYDNKIQYYRHYLDNVFYCLGQIHSRFATTEKGNHDIVAAKKNLIKLNRTNYDFSEDNFPILSNKMPRNIIEHVDERNLLTIKESNGVGGFNVIFEDSDQELISDLLDNRQFYPYILDLRNKSVYFYNIQSNADNNKEFQINLLKLKEELLKLKKNIKKIDNYLEWPFRTRP